MRRCEVKPYKYYKKFISSAEKIAQKSIVINTDEYLGYIPDILQLSATELRL